MTVLDWLLDSPQSARGSRPRGGGARLLGLRDDDGQWAPGAYFPAHGASPESNHSDVDGSEADAAGDASGDEGWVAEAVELLRTKRQPDGTWLLKNTHPGKVHFALEDGDGRAQPVEHPPGDAGPALVRTRCVN